MLTVADIRTYLQSKGVTALIESGLEPVEQPDRVVFVTPLAGAGEARERTFERPGVQIRARGNQNDDADAAALAQQVDTALFDAVPPLQIGGKHVTVIQWAGGGPALIGRDDARRSEYACTYIVEKAR